MERKKWELAPSPSSDDLAVAVPSSGQQVAIWERERCFHDKLAQHVDPETVESGQESVWDRALMDMAGDIRGRTVLDAGCGQGDLTLRLLQRGARVIALDLSPGMVGLVRRRSARFGYVRPLVESVVAPLERTGLATGSVDLAVGRFVLHHTALTEVAAELHRVLRPDGRGMFIENSGANPLLNFSRDHLTGRLGIPRFGTKDEHPLIEEDLEALRRHFADVQMQFPAFDFFTLFDRQVFRYRSPLVSRFMVRLDETLARRSRVSRFSYRTIVVAQKLG